MEKLVLQNFFEDVPSKEQHSQEKENNNVYAIQQGPSDGVRLAWAPWGRADWELVRQILPS